MFGLKVLLRGLPSAYPCSIRTFPPACFYSRAPGHPLPLIPNSLEEATSGVFLFQRRTYKKFATFPNPDPSEHHYTKVLLPPLDQQRGPVPIKMKMYRMRSFDRKDMGQKPKPKLDVPPHKWLFEVPKEYTHKPIQVTRSGGRHPLTRRVIYRRIGGGVKPEKRLIDTKRVYIPESETPIEEKVFEVREDTNIRSGHIALIGYEASCRWVIATEHMKPGQIVRSSRAIPRMTVRAFEGDTYALGALPVGTVVSSVEVRPGRGGQCARAAGVCASILKKEPGAVTIQLPSKQTLKVDEHCIATVGRVSNPHWMDIDWEKAGNTRRRGIRPKSGLWHRKDGYCGRKIHPPKPLRNYLLPPQPKQEKYFFSARPA